MDKTNIHHLRESIYSKFSKLAENEKIQDYEEDLHINDNNEIESEYEFNEDIMRQEISYITDTKEINILYVDDESNNLTAFLACFRQDYNIFLAHTTDLALDILKKEKIDIIITDQKMPKLTGLEFLIKVKNTIPKTPIFMILSAYVDADVLINAINNVHIFKFLHKPFDLEEIKKSISEAYSYHLNK